MRNSWKRFLKGGILFFGLSIVLLGTAGYFYGEELLWSAVMPDHAELIREEGVPSDLSEGAWREDVRYLGRQLPGRLARFQEAVDSSAFNRRLDSTLTEVSGLDRHGRVLEIMKLMNLPQNRGYGGGHTLAPPFQRPLNWGFYPFYTYHFEDGVWVVLSGGVAAEARGSEILEMNGYPVEWVLQLGRPYISADNRHSRRDRLAAHLSYAGFLKGLGVVPDDGTLELLLRRPDGETFTLVLRPSKLFSFGGMQWGRTLQQPVDTWSPADPRPRNRNYYFEYRREDSLLYFQFNRVSNEPGESIEEFAGRLKRFVEQNDIDRFAIDLRSNGGGNNRLLEPLLSFISGHPKLDRRGKLYTLISRRTYSAAGSFACALERRTRTLFAGEPSGFTPNHLGDAVTVALPQSRLLVNISSRYWEDDGPFGRRRWVEPDLHVPLSAANHFDGHDPVMQAVIRHEAGPGPLHLQKEEAPEVMSGRYRFGAFRVLEFNAAGDSLAGFAINGLGTWAASGLYPANRSGTRFSTDIREVYLELDRSGDLWVDWRGSVRRLPKMDPDELAPLEQLNGLGKEGGVSVDTVVKLFRRLKAKGPIPDSHTEFEINRIGYELLGAGRVKEAVLLFRLQTELYPSVANAYDSLGDGLMAMGNRSEARQAFQKALELNPGFEHPEEMLEKLSDLPE